MHQCTGHFTQCTAFIPWNFGPAFRREIRLKHINTRSIHMTPRNYYNVIVSVKTLSFPSIKGMTMTLNHTIASQAIYAYCINHIVLYYIYM